MAKGQKRSNREPKKPKQPKPIRGILSSAALSLTSVTRDAVGRGRDRYATGVGGR